MLPLLSVANDWKRWLKNSTDGVFRWAERVRWIERLPAFSRDYARDYPQLRLLEENYPVIREECLALIARRDRMTDMEALGGKYTKGGVHAIEWKTFAFKLGSFVPENCVLCPGTAALLRATPGVYTAMFSLLEPRQHIAPHWGYWRGFVRYHLGIVIPGDNADRTCWMRVNADPAHNALADKKLIENGERYYWKNGEGVIFDDTNLHEARNDSDQARVVLFVDMRRRLPILLRIYNEVCLFFARFDGALRTMRWNAIRPPLPETVGGPPSRR